MKGRCMRWMVRLASGVLLLLTTLQANQNVEEKFLNAGLVPLSGIDPSIHVDLVNTDKEKNFFRKDFYGNLQECYLQKEVALKLQQAQKNLKKERPGYSLLIMDCARPRSVSKAMYEQLKDTSYKKYVADPKGGSMHNYGAAVDLTVIDDRGTMLDMGMTPFYKSGIEMFFSFMGHKLSPGLSEEERRNRALLKSVMQKAGFSPIALEWWHFNGYEKEIIRSRYEIVE